MKHGQQKQIADKVGVTSQFISQILSGNRRPSWEKAKKLASITGTKPELWLDGNYAGMKKAISKLDFN